MKDLFVLTADADAEALLRAILKRHTAPRIREIDFEVRRFPGRDSGMVKEGPEIARVMADKRVYGRLLLAWDHHGSGWESRTPPDKAVEQIQLRLDGVTWIERSAALVMVPELEEWLWHCPESLRRHLGVSPSEFAGLIEAAARKLEKPVESCMRELPKELFGLALHSRKRRQPLPEDFRAIGSTADLNGWLSSETFAGLARTLQMWFPTDA